MGFTHAYFPLFAFKEFAFRKNWAFACRDEGYLAITASNPISLIKKGQGAYRELRCLDDKTIWVCQMGSKALDGDFTEFQEKITSLPLNFNGESVWLKTLRGDELALDWESPLKINNQVVINPKKHYNYAWIHAEYPCQQLEAQHGDTLLRLNFTPNSL